MLFWLGAKGAKVMLLTIIVSGDIAISPYKLKLELTQNTRWGRWRERRPAGAVAAEKCPVRTITFDEKWKLQPDELRNDPHLNICPGLFTPYYVISYKIYMDFIFYCLDYCQYCYIVSAFKVVVVLNQTVFQTLPLLIGIEF